MRAKIIGTLVALAGLSATLAGCTPDEQRFIATTTIESVIPDTVIGTGVVETITVTVAGVGQTSNRHSAARVTVSAGQFDCYALVLISDVRHSAFNDPEWRGTATVTMHLDAVATPSATVTKLI